MTIKKYAQGSVLSASAEGDREAPTADEPGEDETEEETEQEEE
jgi:hypothetical protein